MPAVVLASSGASTAYQMGNWAGQALGLIIMIGFIIFVIRKWRKAYKGALALRATLEAAASAASESQATSVASASPVQVVVTGDNDRPGSDRGSDLYGANSVVPAVVSRRRTAEQVMEQLPEEVAAQIDVDDLAELMAVMQVDRQVVNTTAVEAPVSRA